jgi:plastocyanin
VRSAKAIKTFTLLGFATALGAVSSTSASTTTTAATQVRKLTAAANGDLKFDRTRLSVRRGIVVLRMSNPSDLPHGIAVAGKGIDKQGAIVDKGGTSKVRVRFRRTGKYVFYCPFDGHRAAGMKGTLIVK